MSTQRWTVGGCTITSVVEEQVEHVPPEMFFPDATAAAVARHGWLVPDFADERGRVALRVQAFVVECAGRCVLVDPCVGNGKTLAVPYWNERTFPFLERFAAAGFAPERVDTVVHTHLHADHVGWDTQLAGGTWVPTFVRARHLYTRRELDWCRAGGNPGIDGVYAQSVAPVVDAGLADVVAEDADLGDGLRLEPSPGHTPGHVSLWIESDGAVALVTGDFLHHPVQCAEPAWAEVADENRELARQTRRAFLRSASERHALFLGTHFPSLPAGRVVADGGAWRFVPERGRATR
jgi:glyoxylase-like metal-dependent hydrolase (beta-lactamase superfamily II)